MADGETTLAHLRQRVADFIHARDWEQYHTPRNLSVAIAVEAAELMEHFQWSTPEQAEAGMQQDAKRAAVAEELADVLIYALSLANALNLDLSTTICAKLATNESRFPVGQWRGRARGVDDAGSGPAR